MPPSEPKNGKLREAMNRMERDLALIVQKMEIRDEAMLARLKSRDEKLDEIHEALRGEKGLVARVFILWDRQDRATKWTVGIAVVSIGSLVSQIIQSVLHNN